MNDSSLPNVSSVLSGMERDVSVCVCFTICKDVIDNRLAVFCKGRQFVTQCVSY